MILASVALGAGPAMAAPTATEIRDAVRSLSRAARAGHRRRVRPAAGDPESRRGQRQHPQERASSSPGLLRARQVETRLLEHRRLTAGRVRQDRRARRDANGHFLRALRRPADPPERLDGEPFEPTLRKPGRLDRRPAVPAEAARSRVAPVRALRQRRQGADHRHPRRARRLAGRRLAARRQPAVLLRRRRGSRLAASRRAAEGIRARPEDRRSGSSATVPSTRTARSWSTSACAATTSVELTVYGPNRGLHSGHYGNWAPNPIVLLTHLLDSMRDTQARILIPGFYDDVRAADGERSCRPRARCPDYDAQIKRELGLARTEGEPASLQTQLMLPALNVRGIAGGHVGDAASNVIVSEATASIDFRLVPDQTPEGVRRRVEQHVERRATSSCASRPTQATRLAHQQIAMLAWDNEGSYPAHARRSTIRWAQQVGSRRRADGRRADRRRAHARRQRARVPVQGPRIRLSSACRSRTTTTISTPRTRTCACRTCGTPSRSSQDCSSCKGAKNDEAASSLPSPFCLPATPGRARETCGSSRCKDPEAEAAGEMRHVHRVGEPRGEVRAHDRSQRRGAAGDGQGSQAGSAVRPARRPG